MAQTRSSSVSSPAPGIPSREGVRVDGWPSEQDLKKDAPSSNLRHWSAEDFANIYVRYRPHLATHARRFCSSPDLVDEVVQDAFLYLMTALPELDSELGVLRFLKWKVKMLCIDEFRSAPRQQFLELDAELLESRVNLDPSEELENAEDAAIVRLALSKLSPRQREAIVASIYEEKSNEEVAAQMGLSGNALRQLLFRAKSSFREVFLSEASKAGLNPNEILATRRRRQSLATVLTVAVSLPLLIPGLIGSNTTTVDAATDHLPAFAFSEPNAARNTEIDSKTMGDIFEPVDEVMETTTPSTLAALPPLLEEQRELSPAVPSEREADFPESNPTVPGSSASSAGEPSLFANILASELEGSSANLGVDIQVSNPDWSQVSFNLREGVDLHLGISPESESLVQFVFMTFSSSEFDLVAVPKGVLAVRENSNSVESFSVAATDWVVGDFVGTSGGSSEDLTNVMRLVVNLKLSSTGSSLSLDRWEVDFRSVTPTSTREA